MTPTAPSTPPPDGVIAGARQFARSVVTGLLVAGCVALAAPVIGYRADVATIREQMQLRVSREAEVYAEALRLYLGAMESELARVAERPEIDLLDGSTASEQFLLDATHRGSTWFGLGVVVLDREGRPVWSEPAGVLRDTPTVARQRWFQELLERGTPVLDATTADARTFVVAVPIVRDGALVGALAGFLTASTQALAGWRDPTTADDVLVLSASGAVFLPEHPPDWTHGTDLRALVRRVPATRGAEVVELGGRQRLAAASPIGTTGLGLLLVTDEERVIAPARRRLLLELATIGALQLLTIGLFSVFFRRIYRSFLQVEARAASQERLAALGEAAGLIAHEVKNSLNGLRAAAALQEAGTDPALAARTIRGQTERLGHLATSLLHFGRPPAPRLVRARLDAIAAEVLDGLRVLPEFGEVTITTALADPVTVRCDPVLVTTALDNLVRNAIEAGAVAHDLGAQDAPTVHVAVARQGDAGVVSVEDNAGGPAADVAGRLFEPFVTAKPKGIGLGLAMARRAIEQQGGTLAFARSAAGSRFTIRLPQEAA